MRTRTRGRSIPETTTQQMMLLDLEGAPGYPPSEIMGTLASQKHQGAYYTNPAVARFLVNWAIRHPSDRVLDPCFGRGVFLQASLRRLTDLGGRPPLPAFGIEIDPWAHTRTAKGLLDGMDLPHEHLTRSNFFAVTRHDLGGFSVVVGNPPFIRYQNFSGKMRSLALQRAESSGVRFSALASAWAPFLVHAIGFLEEGGRLAVVAPAELCHAAYARPLLPFLQRSFRESIILTFERRLFPDLSEDTVLVLADGFGRGAGEIRLLPLRDASELEDGAWAERNGTAVDADSVASGSERMVSYLLPEPTRRLYRELSAHPLVKRLGDLASVGIGYVTGANGYFHLSTPEARALRIPARYLRPAVRRATWLRGLFFTPNDWRMFESSGEKSRLLHLPDALPRAPKGLRTYLAVGKRQGIPEAYKCRVREPWFAVPHVDVPDGFLAYMADERPMLAVNKARAVAPNTLLCVNFVPMFRQACAEVAAAWWTSLGALSAEVEGHSLGGGMLKLEPGEAAKVTVPLPISLMNRSRGRDLALRIDRTLRSGDWKAALELGDAEILHHGLGLPDSDCTLLRAGFEFLMHRRRRR